MNISLSTDTPREVMDLLIDLKMLAGIPTGSKINLHNKSYTSGNTLFNGVYRFIYGQDKNKTVDYIEKILKDAVVISCNYPRYQNIIIDNITSISGGLTNLIHTYSEYKEITFKLDLFILRCTKESFIEACNNINETPVKN